MQIIFKKESTQMHMHELKRNVGNSQQPTSFTLNLDLFYKIETLIKRGETWGNYKL